MCKRLLQQIGMLFVHRGLQPVLFQDELLGIEKRELNEF